MIDSNYLMDFLYKTDVLISEINKLNSKIRLYQRNSNTFDIPFEIKFSISPDTFVNLRNFLHDKIEEGSNYNKEIVDLRREFLRNFSYLIIKIEQEIARIENFQENEMNKIVYAAICNTKIKNEMTLRNSFYVSSSLIDKFLGIDKFRKLSYKNHELKAKLIEKEYKEGTKERKNIFELVCMIENENVKDGELLCLQDEIINSFMLDRRIIKRNNDYSWKQANLLPTGFFEKRAYYKILNKNLSIENEKLEKDLKSDLLVALEEKSFDLQKLIKLNVKLTKILKNGLAIKI